MATAATISGLQHESGSSQETSPILVVAACALRVFRASAVITQKAALPTDDC